MGNRYIERYKPMLDRMPEGEEKTFLVTRVFFQMNFYKSDSDRFRKRYQLFALLSIIFNGVIPVLMLLADLGNIDLWVRLITAALSAAAGILTAISAMKNYRELWIEYRLTLELLHLLVDRYFLKVGEFGSDDPAVRREALQSQFEKIISEEHRQWKDLLTEAKKAS